MDFLTSCRVTSQDIHELSQFIETMNKQTINKQNSVLSSKEEARIDEDIDLLIKTIDSSANKIKDNLKEMDRETKAMKEENKNKFIIEMRETHTLRHKNLLKENLKNFQNIQIAAKEREQRKVKETYLIACPDATEEQLNSLDDPEKAEALLEAAFAMGSNSAKSILTEARNRSKRIDQIAFKVKNLINLINEIHNLVLENDATVDQLVITMEATEKNTEEATKELVIARDYQDRANWFKRVAFFVFIVFIVIIILIFVKPLLEK